ncbi:MAG: DUF2892 domain-containing protein [Fibrobacteria bacterium]|nr:DUF2892 domain-containing protein [Fibrobacteria bacterium]
MEFANAGAIDRSVRVLLGAVLLGLGWGGVVEGIPGLVMKYGGFVALFTGVAGFCPLYLPFGITTRRKPS